MNQPDGAAAAGLRVGSRVRFEVLEVSGSQRRAVVLQGEVRKLLPDGRAEVAAAGRRHRVSLEKIVDVLFY